MKYQIHRNKDERIIVRGLGFMLVMTGGILACVALAAEPGTTRQHTEQMNTLYTWCLYLGLLCACSGAVLTYFGLRVFRVEPEEDILAQPEQSFEPALPECSETQELPLLPTSPGAGILPRKLKNTYSVPPFNVIPDDNSPFRRAG